MAIEKERQSTAESLRQTRTYGKFRCHNPSCMGRLQPEAGQKQVKCPECGMEFRVYWIRPDFPRIRGPVWDVNRKLAQEALVKKEGTHHGIESKNCLHRSVHRRDRDQAHSAGSAQEISRRPGISMPTCSTTTPKKAATLSDRKTH